VLEHLLGLFIWLIYFTCVNVAGGYDRAECLKCVELYDPETNLWDTLSSMKEARGRFDIAVVKGKVYAIGGSNGTTELATVEKYDPQEKKWTQITPLPLARCNIGKCIVCIYVYHSSHIYTCL
jgi:influenza virus NS1A-binding protein